jgi:protein TonB
VAALAIGGWWLASEGAGGRFRDATEIQAIDVEIVTPATGAAAPEAAAVASSTTATPSAGPVAAASILSTPTQANDIAPPPPELPAPTLRLDTGPPEVAASVTAPTSMETNRAETEAPQKSPAETRQPHAPDEAPAQTELAASPESGAGQPQPERSGASPGEITRYQTQLRAIIARRTPPGIGQRGTAIVAFEIEPSGALRHIEIKSSSGNPILDRRALAAVSKSAPFPKPPARMTQRQRLYTIPFHFR